jgi:GNAT superfamily N-acetyltransferase
MEKPKLTNQDVLAIAMQQSAYDGNCAPEDFCKSENVVTVSREHPLARKYLKLPLSCDLVSYGSNIVAQASQEIAPLVRQYIDRYPVEHCFETPNLHVLDEMLRPFGQKICFMAEYFLPDVNAVRELPCGYELRVLHQTDFAQLYLPQWSNALCEKRKHLDVLGVGAYDGEKLIGLAGCSADCDMMYQIGVDVLPEYRRKGIASALTSRLALEILALGKVPFYCAAWSNIKSVRNAIRSGFRPAWVQITAKTAGFVDEMNQ